MSFDIVMMKVVNKKKTELRKLGSLNLSSKKIIKYDFKLIIS